MKENVGTTNTKEQFSYLYTEIHFLCIQFCSCRNNFQVRLYKSRFCDMNSLLDTRRCLQTNIKQGMLHISRNSIFTVAIS